MPSTLTHYYISEQILAALDERTRQIILAHKKLYSLGAQGPDILMGLMLEKDLDKKLAGDRLHEVQVYAGLHNTADYLRTHQTDTKIFAYYMGCITHYAADSVVHPFVYDYVENRMKQKFDPILNNCLHTIIETEMDAYIGIYPMHGKHANSISHISGSYSTRKTVKRYYLDVNKDVFKLKLDGKDINTSVFLYRVLVRLCHRYNNGKIRFNFCQLLDNYLKAEHLLMAALRPRSLDTRNDYLNMEHKPYKSLHVADDNCPKDNHTFPELVDLAIEKGVKLIKLAVGHIFDGAPMPIDYFDLDYNGSPNPEYEAAKLEGKTDNGAISDETTESQTDESEACGGIKEDIIEAPEQEFADGKPTDGDGE